MPPLPVLPLSPEKLLKPCSEPRIFLRKFLEQHGFDDVNALAPKSQSQKPKSRCFGWSKDDTFERPLHTAARSNDWPLVMQLIQLCSIVRQF